MSASNEKSETALREICRDAVRALWPDLAADQSKKLAERVRHVLRAKAKGEGAKKPLIDSFPSPSPRLLTNIALLNVTYDFAAAEIRDRLGPERSADNSRVRTLLRRNRRGIEFTRAASERALSIFERVEELLLSEKQLDAMDLREVYYTGLKVRSEPSDSYRLSLAEVREIDRIKATKAFQSGDADALCRVVEIYIEAGAVDIAADYLEPAIEDQPNHPGLRFQKARLSMALAGPELRSASHFKLLMSESEPVSAAEAHWRETAEEYIDRAAALWEQAFEASLTALCLMTSGADYEAQAPRWSTDYGTMRRLRGRILTLVVKEAGRRVSFAWDQEREVARLSDRAGVLVAAYDELISSSIGIPDPIELLDIRLYALAYLRCFAPNRYPAEVERLLADVRRIFPPLITKFVGALDTPAESYGISTRALFFQHLDAILDRGKRRELVRELHQRWIEWIEAERDKGLASLFLMDALSNVSDGQYAKAHDLLREGQAEGVIDPDVDEHAFFLWRVAAGAARAAEEAGALAERDMIVAGPLSDRALIERAKRYDYDRWDEIEGGYTPLPLDDEGIDEFLTRIATAPPPS